MHKFNQSMILRPQSSFRQNAYVFAPNELHDLCHVVSGVVARYEAIQGSKLCSLDCFVPRNDATYKFISAVGTEGTWALATVKLNLLILRFLRISLLLQEEHLPFH